MLWRRPGMSEAAFQAYWRDHHGPLVRATRSGAHVLRYVQHHRAVDAGTGRYVGTVGDADGVAEQWFASHDEYAASLAEDDFALIAADLPRFLDVSRLVFVLTDEADEITAPD